jgi:TPR repeat protein
MIRNAEECEPFEESGSLAACERACELNHSNSCANWAAGLQSENARRAKRLYQRACTGGSGIGCEGLARMIADDISAEEAAAHYLSARRYHRVHCAQGYARSCSQLAALLDQGLGGAADTKTGSMYRQRACRLGRISSCPGETIIPSAP